MLAICQSAVQAFADLGCQVEEASPGMLNPDQLFLGQIVPRLLVQFEQELPANFQEQLDPAAVSLLKLGIAMSARDAYAAVYGDYAIHDLLVSFFQEYDLFLTPTLATPAYGLWIFGPDQVAGEPVARALELFFTYPFNLSGQPAASVPAGFTHDGLPVGLQIIGRRYDEATVLRASARFEEARPWAGRWPEL